MLLIQGGGGRYIEPFAVHVDWGRPPLTASISLVGGDLLALGPLVEQNPIEIFAMFVVVVLLRGTPGYHPSPQIVYSSNIAGFGASLTVRTCRRQRSPVNRVVRKNANAFWFLCWRPRLELGKF